MGIINMEKTIKLFANTLLEAESALQKLKEEHGGKIKKSSIDRKVKKEEEYYIIVVTIENYSIKDLFE